ncbi:MAG: hypothetical protein GY759_21105 [Chloroflexi bacterium]|nr:hypothetical protein [Chloroflexota bacterium]
MEQFFPETNRWVRGPFLEFYREFGLDICGYPITDVFEEYGLSMQYFQRVALEEHEPGRIRLRLAAQHALEAEARIDELEARVQQLQQLLRDSSDTSPQPAIIDIIEQLPRDASAMYSRPLTDVKHVVINHTAVRPGVTIKRIAEAHRQRWPAIVCHFYVEGDGTIYQTNPLAEVVDQHEPWLRDGVHIHVAGDFSETIPTSAQMEALADLCAWLLDMTDLQTSAVQGASELTNTKSPGEQWLQGAGWKNLLALQINVLRDSTGIAVLDLHDTIDRLKIELSALQEERSTLLAELAEAETRIVSLVEQVALRDQALTSNVQTSIEQPRITDVITELPRDDAAMIARPANEIRYIVINHTAVMADVPINRVAKAHRVRWPAIICQFYIEGNGDILQTNPIDQVVDNSQEWLHFGINIHVAGNFLDEIPTEEQLTSLSQLTAWLLTTYNLQIERLKGVQEFIVTQSPGEQWQRGLRWKDVLLARVQTLLENAQGSGPGDGALLELYRAQIEQLQADNATMQAQVDRLEELKLALESERSQLKYTIEEQQRLIDSLRSDPDKPTDPPATVAVARPVIHDIISQLAKHPRRRYSQRNLDEISHIAIHHSAAPANVTAERIAEYHVNDESHQWPGIGYHYYISPDGTIYQTQSLEKAAYHVYRNDEFSIGVCVAGTFTTVLPTPVQISSAAHLLAWLMQEFLLPFDKVMGHKEFPHNITSCPGKQWLTEGNWKDKLFAQVQAVRSGSHAGALKSLEHYVLFWQQPTAWAEDDWLGALNYIARFRPSAGFSQEDAKAAQRVTIIGGVAGVNQQVENALRSAGCLVERIAGQDVAETKAMLDRMAETGQRYLRP